MAGLVILFLTSLENRRKRNQALAGLSELRGVAHVIDLHQMTKDPQIAAARIAEGDEVDQLDPRELALYLSLLRRPALDRRQNRRPLRPGAGRRRGAGDRRRGRKPLRPRRRQDLAEAGPGPGRRALGEDPHPLPLSLRAGEPNLEGLRPSAPRWDPNPGKGARGRSPSASSPLPRLGRGAG